MIIQQLEGWTMLLRPIPVARLDRHSGLPLMNGGEPITDTQYELALVEKATGNQIRFRFDEEAKAGLVEALTGGIQVARSMPEL